MRLREPCCSLFEHVVNGSYEDGLEGGLVENSPLVAVSSSSVTTIVLLLFTSMVNVIICRSTIIISAISTITRMVTSICSSSDRLDPCSEAQSGSCLQR